MARLLTLDTCAVSLRDALLESLQTSDEAILLPQSSISPESGCFKNVVCRLTGSSGGRLNASMFSPDWFTGASLVHLHGEDTRRLDELLSSPEQRRIMLDRLKDGIRSEVCDSTTVVGPQLDCATDERDHEGAPWIAGLDSTTSFVGIYSADHLRIPENGQRGTHRVHKNYYLVCKAGAGAAAATFHSRFLAACEAGKSLDDILENSDAPGPQGLRRVSMAAHRNRARVLVQAAAILGLKSVTSVPDHAARSASERLAVCDIDVSVNSIRKLDETRGSTWQYSLCVDGGVSKGLVSMSNAGDGMVLFITSSGDHRISLKNDVWGCIPFTSKRLLSSKDVSQAVLSEYKRTGSHPDAHWISDRFSWKNRVFTDSQPDVAPLPLWGSHDPESFSRCFARELGLDGFQAVRLHPELVCSAGVDTGKLRAIVRSICRAP